MRDWGNTLHKNDHVDIECDLTEFLPFDDDQFDTIILSDVLEHIPQPERLWSEIARILSKEGKLLMNVPFIYWIHEEPHDYYRYTEFALKRFTDMSGLNLLLIKAMGVTSEILQTSTSKSFETFPTGGRTIAQILQWSARAFTRGEHGRKDPPDPPARCFPLDISSSQRNSDARSPG